MREDKVAVRAREERMVQEATKLLKLEKKMATVGLSQVKTLLSNIIERKGMTKRKASIRATRESRSVAKWHQKEEESARKKKAKEDIYKEDDMEEDLEPEPKQELAKDKPKLRIKDPTLIPPLVSVLPPTTQEEAPGEEIPSLTQEENPFVNPPPTLPS